MPTLIRGAKVYRDGVFSASDIAIENGVIRQVAPDISPNGFGTVLPFHHLYISPGFFDVHVHLREPGFSYKETIAAGTRAAARGGYTALGAMPNLSPAPDCRESLAIQEEMIARDAAVAVYPYACITVGQRGTIIADIEGLAPRVLGFSDDGRGVQDRGLMREAMERVAAAGSILAAHCEDDSLLNGGYIHDGGYARAHGHAGIPAASEYRQIERDLRLADETGCRYHVCHVSAKESVALIRDAKKSGVRVSCETAPHYLLLCDGDLRDEGRFKMNPPIRAAADRDALLAGLLDGTIDLIATDHAPHAEREKSGGLRGSVMGIVGLETAFRVLHTGLVQTGLLTLETLVDRMATAPRRIFQKVGGIAAGQPADLCVIDPQRETVIDSNTFFSLGRSTPFDGMHTVGDVIMTLRGGEVVWSGERKNETGMA